MGDVCKICGCTDEEACMTDEGPCSWVIPGLCSACAVVFHRGEHSKGNYELIIPKECRHCANLEEDKKAEHLGYKNYWRCTEGRYDPVLPAGSTVPGSFAWSGVSLPNKAVARAQKHCLFFRVHSRFLPPAPKETQVNIEEVEKLWKSGEGMMQNPIKREEP